MRNTVFMVNQVTMSVVVKVLLIIIIIFVVLMNFLPTWALASCSFDRHNGPRDLSELGFFCPLPTLAQLSPDKRG